MTRRSLATYTCCYETAAQQGYHANSGYERTGLITRNKPNYSHARSDTEHHIKSRVA